MQLKLLLNCCKFTFFVGLELCNICLYIQVECSFWVTFLFSKKVFFYQGFLSRTLTTHRTAGKGRGPFYCTLPLPHAHQHCTWDDYHIFLIATLVFTRLLLDEFYHLIELLFDWLTCNVDFRLFACWFDFRFCYSYFTWETGGLELASTIILVLQANQLTKCASHAKTFLR